MPLQSHESVLLFTLSVTLLRGRCPGEEESKEYKGITYSGLPSRTDDIKSPLCKAEQEATDRYDSYKSFGSRE